MKRNTLIALRAGKSITSVANDLQITRQMLGAVESGKRTPSLYLAQKIADYYGVTIKDIFFEENGHEAGHKATGTDNPSPL